MVTSSKYRYQEHQTRGAGRGGAAPATAAKRAPASSSACSPASGPPGRTEATTSPSASTTTRRPSSRARRLGTAVGDGARYTRTSPPSPGSTTSRPSPCDPVAGRSAPGRKRMACCHGSSGRAVVAPAAAQPVGLQLCHPSA